MSIQGDSLHRLASNAAVWSEPRAFERDCAGAARCNWPVFRKRIRVQIYADTGARNVGPNPTVAGGALVGKLENMGNATEAMYGLENGPYDYLLYVFPVTGSANGRWVIERVDKSPPYAHVTVSEGIQVGCNHPTAWNSSFGEFRSCADGPPPNPPASARMGANTQSGIRTAGFNLFAGFIALQMLAEDPAWVTCTSGCCVSDEPQLLSPSRQ
ncbi:MAG: hypothetical protein NUW01_19490 [Gemmatimonadaceae bacterium]|nr:hypothetical protein [Gemmatimonadaceae bacterium]